MPAIAPHGHDGLSGAGDHPVRAGEHPGLQSTAALRGVIDRL
jgi:hypothetical protein